MGQRSGRCVRWHDMFPGLGICVEGAWDWCGWCVWEVLGRAEGWSGYGERGEGVERRGVEVWVI